MRDLLDNGDHSIYIMSILHNVDSGSTESSAPHESHRERTIIHNLVKIIFKAVGTRKLTVTPTRRKLHRQENAAFER